MFNHIMGTYWGALLNFSYMFRIILERGFRDPYRLLGEQMSRHEIPVAAAWSALIVVCLLSLVILNVRLRARETVRG
jgi:hypothetical protein